MKPKKPRGRPKGSLNKNTSEIRDILKELIEAELEEAPEILEQCTLEQRAELFVKMGKMILPRITREENADRNESRDIVLNLGDTNTPPRKREETPELRKAIKEAQEKFYRENPPEPEPDNDLREKMKTIFLMEYEFLKDKLGQLSPAKRISFLLKISQFVLPRPSGNEKDKQVQTWVIDTGNGKVPTVNVFRPVH